MTALANARRWGMTNQRKERQVGGLSHSRSAVILFSVLVIISITAQTSTVHGAPPPLTYTLALSTSRIQEANIPGVTMTLNVSNTMSGSFYGFSWNVTDPSGGKGSFVYYVAANGPVLTLTAVYPRDFSGASIKYNGTYRINIFQTYPSPAVLVTTGKFYAGLTDSLFYQRTAQVSILAQGYASNENITIRILHAGIPASGFPISQLANGNGVFSYLWPIPVSTPLGDYNVSLSGQVTLKKPPDSQIFTILPTSVSISQLVANVTLLQGTQVADFTFSSTYPDGTQANTGTATVRVIEPNGITNHLVSVTYNSTSKAFRGTYLLLVAVILMAAALAVVVSWVLFFGRKRVQRNVLKVDFQSIEREAARVENRDFFAKVHDQLKQQTKPEADRKDG